MKSSSQNVLVGLFVVLTLLVLILFGWFMGIGSLAGQSYTVLYDFAGGIEEGSPVRVAGIKVGRVERIEFTDGAETTLRLKIAVSPKAVTSVRMDSKFYVNMAGIIGERYIEISRGTDSSPKLAPGSVVRGVDPPRIDQFLSQGYGFFGKLQEFFDQNEEVLSHFLTQSARLISDANKLLEGSDKRKLISLIENLNRVSLDLHEVLGRLNTEGAERSYSKLKDLIDRAHAADKEELKKFLQQEGIRARIF